MKTRKAARLRKSSQKNCLEIPANLQPEMIIKNQMEEEEKKRIMNQVTRNPLLVQEVLKYLNFQDLKSCRVNHMWNCLSSSLILKRDCAVVKLNFDRKNNHYYHHHQPQQQDEEEDSKSPVLLKELNKVIESPLSSSSFPCTNFHFCGGNLKDVDATQFFKLHGSNVRSLELANISYYCRGARRKRRKAGEKDDPALYTTKSVLRKILMNDVPNLKNLSLQNFDFNWTESDHLELPDLQSLEWDGAKKTVFKILKGSPNLKKIKAELTFDDIVVINKSKNKAAGKAAMLYVLNYKNS